MDSLERMNAISGDVTSEARAGAGDHPALLAWRKIDRDRTNPVSIRRLDTKKRDSTVYQLTFGDSASVIAKRCPREGALVEAAVYERVLPHVSVPRLRYYGTVHEPDGTFGWVFVQEAVGDDYVPDEPEHRDAAARWLAAFHGEASRLDLCKALPDRGVGYHLEHLQSACGAISAGLSNSALNPADRSVLEAVLTMGKLLDSRWSNLEGFFHNIPRTVVHNDFCAANLRVQRVDGRLGLLPFDWGSSGWGVPAVDLAQFSEGEMTYSVRPDLEAYQSVVRKTWPQVNREAVRLLAEFGAVFLALSELHWEGWRLSYEYQSERELEWLAEYIHMASVSLERLSDVARAAGWKK